MEACALQLGIFIQVFLLSSLYTPQVHELMTLEVQVAEPIIFHESQWQCSPVEPGPLGCCVSTSSFQQQHRRKVLGSKGGALRPAAAWRLCRQC